jgi:hypothetical protein
MHSEQHAIQKYPLTRHSTLFDLPFLFIFIFMRSSTCENELRHNFVCLMSVYPCHFFAPNSTQPPLLSPYTPTSYKSCKQMDSIIHSENERARINFLFFVCHFSKNRNISHVIIFLRQSSSVSYFIFYTLF